MKTSHSAALAAALIAMCVTSTRGQAEQPGNPSIPVGTLDAYPMIVQAGTHPTLTWGIDYPATVLDFVNIDADSGTVTPKECVNLELRVLGASVQTSPTNWLTVEAYAQIANGGWEQFFRDKQPKVKPTKVLFQQEVSGWQPINIGGRCYNRGWYPFYNTAQPSWNVVVLIDGDKPPESTPAFQQGRIESFLRPYIDDAGHIEIGPGDVIFLYELAMTNPSQSSFDLQDLVVLATFSKCKTNNGHGNNLDGVDSSNVGNAPFIPYDSDPTVDDEAGTGVGAYPSLN